jgi:hypothetical protein
VSDVRVHPRANTSYLVSSRCTASDERADGSMDQMDDDQVRDAPVADREDPLLATTHRPDSRSATRRIRSKSAAEGVTLPEV